MAKAICRSRNHNIEAEENGEKEWKALSKVMNNDIYSKSMEKLRNKIDVKLVSNKKDYLKWTSKPSYMSQKICDNNVVTIRKSKVTLALNKPAYVGMSILDLSKVIMYEFHYDFIENEYGKQLKTIIHWNWQLDVWN